ncbi:MAG: gliding motility protein, GldB [Flavobacteriaceae bacterium]|nr:MAG: gliding motility protein, GldB [Flavobacteriaceae bacterium]
MNPTNQIYKSLIVALSLAFLVGVLSCQKDQKTWPTKVDSLEKPVEFVHLSDDFFNLKWSLVEFDKKYPFFLDKSYPIEHWEARRKDPLELEAYGEVKKTYADLGAIQKEITSLLEKQKHHFPTTQTPTVYFYSSGYTSLLRPIIYSRDQNKLFVALDGFLREDHPAYLGQQIPAYIRKTMTPEFVLPKIAFAISEQMVYYNIEDQKFLDQMIYQGKLMACVDAFLPEYQDHQKILYTPQQLNWAKENEYFIWAYFVENEYLFSQDKGLLQRFINQGAFSKFYNEKDKESPGSIGVWVGWQLVRSYLSNQNTTLEELSKDKDNQKLFERAKYKPRKP